MKDVDRIVKLMRANPADVKFNDLCKVCAYYLGEPRQKGGSHRIYKTPCKGDPRVNIQDKNGKAKPYQVRQVLQVLDRLGGQNG
ncbi:MAG: toxin HicA [Dehalogenimonas sp.]